jgi:hypothetical protein
VAAAPVEVVVVPAAAAVVVAAGAVVAEADNDMQPIHQKYLNEN